ncbi:rod shape-determining protein MreD [Candidatus Blochmanniella floridana]|uniref:Rod shape-determining protein MreD n=1 Tax=Blochmanniella floridana TaxID=203907 RepID=Q7VRC2_BLOFL|nr:rod shape-determining protein MreD [Candidatus Blochmannia floridanus]
MYNFYIYKICNIYCSFAVAIILQYVLFFSITWYLQPSWTMMLLIYWIVLIPNKINIGTGFFLGLILDCISCSTLGIQTLSMSIISYLTIRKIYLFRHTYVWQQSIFIVLFSFINQNIKFLIQFLMFSVSYSPKIFYNCILDGIMWPVLIFLIHKINNSSKIC